MPVYRYAKEITIGDGDEVRLKVVFPDNGTAAHHIIDRPGDDDLERVNEFDDVIGTGADLKKERTIVYTKATNMDANNPNVNVQYFINDVLQVNHTNPKNIDNSPQLKITFTFN